MLRACIIHFDKSWDKCLALEEFAYNNSYQASLKMAPFEALYGRRCRTPLNWSQVGERKFFGPNLVKEAEERVEVIKKLKSRANEAKELPWRGENCKGIPSWRESVLRVSPTTRVQ
jgi:hypothetical protein